MTEGSIDERTARVPDRVPTLRVGEVVLRDDQVGIIEERRDPPQRALVVSDIVVCDDHAFVQRSGNPRGDGDYLAVAPSPSWDAEPAKICERPPDASPRRSVLAIRRPR
jgi:hypothetical protein